MRVVINEFHGMVPKRGSRKLPPGYAERAHNFNLWSGDLKAIKQPQDVLQLGKTGSIRTIYPMTDVLWLHWTQRVSVVASWLQNATTGLVYYTGDGAPKLTDLALATTPQNGLYPVSNEMLGVPGPIAGPGITTAGGSAPQTTRSYVFAYKTARGALGPPSPAATATANANGTWTVSGLASGIQNGIPVANIFLNNPVAGVTTIQLAAVHYQRARETFTLSGVAGTGAAPGTLNATHTILEVPTGSPAWLRISTPGITGTVTANGNWARGALFNSTGLITEIYRTDQAGTYRYVGEQAATLATFNDTVADTALGDPLESTGWISPPGDLHSINLMANGFMIGASGKEVCFSPFNAPHAWPESYRLRVPYDIVGIGVYSNTAIICTKGYPYACEGISPDTMSLRRINLRQPCVSDRSIVEFENGVFYASDDGLVYATGSGASLVTQNLVEREEWQAYKPSSMHAQHYENRYIGFFEGGGTGANEASGICYDPGEANAQFSLMNFQASASYEALETGRLYFVTPTDRKIVWFDAASSEASTYWRSQIFTFPEAINLTAAFVRFKFTAGGTAAQQATTKAAAIAVIATEKGNRTIVQDGAFGGHPAGGYPVLSGPFMNAIGFLNNPSGLVFTLCAADENRVQKIRMTKTLQASEEFRLPSGFKSDEWLIELYGNQVEVYEVVLAESMTELGT